MQKHTEKIKAGLAKAALRGRKGGRPKTVPDDAIKAALSLGTKRGAEKVGLSMSTFIRRRRTIEEGKTNA